MKFLKGLAVTIVGFALFLSLTVFSAMFMLNQTILNPDFIVAELEQLDMSEMGKELIGEQIKEQLPPELSTLSPAVDEIFDEMEPWLKEEMGTLTYAVFYYLTARSERLEVVISLDPVKTSLEGKIRQVLIESPPPFLAGLPEAEREQLVTQYTGQFIGQIPAAFGFDESEIPAEFQGIISQARWTVSRFDVFYNGTIAFMALMVLFIIALYRDVKGVSRSLGSTFLTVGVLGFGGLLAAEYFLYPQLDLFGLPLVLGGWLIQFMTDVTAPLMFFYIGFAVGGLALVLLSVFYRRGVIDD